MSGIEDPESPREGRIRNAILIAGPTASGKSALALELADRVGGVLINTDSMQVYSQLRVLTARPDDQEVARAPHRLYGHVDAGHDYSAARYVDDVETIVRSGELAGRVPIFVGGTGLYFRALTQGLSEMPAIPQDVRDYWRRQSIQEGAPHLHAILSVRDPAVAARLRPTDTQRIVRALEVFDASGRSILDWQASRAEPLIDFASARALVLDIERAALAGRINRRLVAMIGAGAVEEVARLRSLMLDPAKPALKAIGVREFGEYLDGSTTLDSALERAQAATRQYAKRQTTWFRNQFDERWLRLTSSSIRVLDLPSKFLI